MVRKDKPEPGTSSTEHIGTVPQIDDSKFIAGPVKKGNFFFLSSHADIQYGKRFFTNKTPYFDFLL
jgi:hypothetical protein